MALRLRFIPSFSAGSSACSRIPAVSVKMIFCPLISRVSSTVSRVVPLAEETIARSNPTRAFNKLDLPLLGAPTIAVLRPSLIYFPTEKVSANALICARTAFICPDTNSSASGVISSSTSSKRTSICAKSSESLVFISSKRADSFPSKESIASLCACLLPEAIKSHNPCASTKSIFPLKKARWENSPRRAIEAPFSHSSSKSLPLI